MSSSSSSLHVRRDDTKATLTTKSDSDSPPRKTPRKNSGDSDVEVVKVCVIMIV